MLSDVEDEEDWDMLHDLLLMLRMCESYCGRKREECGVGMGMAYYADLERSLQDLEVRRQGFVPEIAKYAELVGSFKGQIATSAARGRPWSHAPRNARENLVASWSASSEWSVCGKAETRRQRGGRAMTATSVSDGRGTRAVEARRAPWRSGPRRPTCRA